MGSTEQLPKMLYRNLGRSGLKVSVISLGGWVTYGGHVGDSIAMDCMKAAFEAGINFFDCAEGYAEGKSEIVMGMAIKKFGWKRNDLVISTKINWGGAYGTNPVNNFGLSRKHLIEGTAAALDRLGLDYVDLLYAHRPDRETPIEETVRAFNYLINAGKCFYWGTSEWNADEIEAAWAVADRLNLIGPVMEQPQYNLLVRDKVELQFSRLYRDHGLGLTIFSPLKTGILSGKYNDGIPEDSRVANGNDNFSKSQRESYGNAAWLQDIEQTRKLKPLADKLGTDQATFALAWVIKNPNVSSAITGASKVEQIGKSVKALDLLPKLTQEIMEEVDKVLENKPAPLQLRFT
jgi:voltage-dependent potassium channel beta subunit